MVDGNIIRQYNNHGILVQAGATGFRTIDQDRAVRVAIFSFRRVVIPAAVTVRPTSSSTNGLVIAASQLISIAGVVDWQGRGALGGVSIAIGPDRIGHDNATSGLALIWS